MRFVPIEEIGSVWPEVKAGLKAVLRKCPDTWIPEDIYCYLKTNRAGLWVFENGFCVTEVITDVHNGARLLNVWALYCKNLEPIEYEVLQRLDELARQAKCLKIRFSTKRDGWILRSKGEFKPVLTVYERDVL